jgi:hypothetical protein
MLSKRANVRSRLKSVRGKMRKLGMTENDKGRMNQSSNKLLIGP